MNRRTQGFELINVHQVRGDADAIVYLKNSDHDVVEGLFYQAKHTGSVRFEFRGQTYLLTRNRDFSFTIELDKEQTLSPESLS